MTATASGLHPLSLALAAAELRFSLRDAACPDETVGIECTYRPRREGDVRKERSLHLLGSLFRAGSGNLISVQREEFHVVRRDVHATKTGITFTVPLRDPDADHGDYQLAQVSVGDLVFERWFAEKPELDPGFGLECTVDALRGDIRATGIASAPLAGKLPLWPTLRVVELRVASVSQPVVRLWEPMEKHYWDGWRQTTPQEWPGGRSIVARQIAGPTVWRAHEYFAFPPSGAPPVNRPAPPEGVVSGVALEIFWPEGATLEFPEVRFDQPASTIALRVGRLTTRARELLARSATLRPGVELNSLTTAEWSELDALVDQTAPTAVDFALQTNSDGKELMVAHRRNLTEPWLCLFGTGYDSDRRYALTALVLNPERWSGPLPE